MNNEIAKALISLSSLQKQVNKITIQDRQELQGTAFDE
jgi:hypothetical protein